MEVESIVVESNKPEEVFPKLCVELKNLGFEDVHKKSIEQACYSLDEILGVDFMKRKSFKKRIEKPRPHLLINKKMESALVLGEPVSEEGGFEEAFGFTCFSKSKNEITNLLVTLKGLHACIKSPRTSK